MNRLSPPAPTVNMPSYLLSRYRDCKSCYQAYCRLRSRPGSRLMYCLSNQTGGRLSHLSGRRLGSRLDHRIRGSNWGWNRHSSRVTLKCKNCLTNYVRVGGQIHNQVTRIGAFFQVWLGKCSRTLEANFPRYLSVHPSIGFERCLMLKLYNIARILPSAQGQDSVRVEVRMTTTTMVVDARVTVVET